MSTAGIARLRESSGRLQRRFRKDARTLIRMEATASAPDEPEPLPVFVLATTAEPTRHALAVARRRAIDGTP